MVRTQTKSTVSFPLRTALAALSVSTVLLGAMTAQAQQQTAANPPQAPQPAIAGKLAPLGLA
ncbi:hypothetical protein, partial [Pseudochrobactrum sp. AO18b]